jgi:hypothetical protein
MLPNNLRPLSTMPWDERPDELPIDIEEARTALWRCEGNISAAATLLKVPSSRFRALVNKSAYLQREVNEAKQQLVDMAEVVVKDALGDPDRADAMARFVLSTQGKERGWGNGSGGPSVNIKSSGNIVFQWQDGSELSVTDSKDIIDVNPSTE